MLARAMVTEPSSSGWRSSSSTLRGNSGQLVQEQHAVVRQADLAGPRHARAAADQAGVGNGVVRRAERPLAQQARALRQDAGDAVDLGGLERLLEGQRRQDAGQALGQHGLARARRPDHEHVVHAGGGHLERALGGGLAAHVAEVERDAASGARGRPARGDGRRELLRARPAARPPRPGAARRTRARLPPPRPRRRSPAARPASQMVLRARRRRSEARRAPAARRRRATVRPPAGARRSWATVPMAPRMPTAIGRSNPAPSLRTLAGRQVDGDGLVGIAEARVHAAPT